MPTLKLIVKTLQPEVYEKLMAIRPVPVPDKKKPPKKKNPPKISTRDIENLMRHDSHKRSRGGIKQTGWSP